MWEEPWRYTKHVSGTEGPRGAESWFDYDEGSTFTLDGRPT